MAISGFTFIHNSINAGIPIVESIQAVKPFVDELVVVDMQSDDGTRKLLEKLDVRIIDGQWGNEAGLTLQNAHALNAECKYKQIIHFEADEVYDTKLLRHIVKLIKDCHCKNISCYRLQVEQNFQRIRWYPELVHRVFIRGTVTKKGHTTDKTHLKKMVYTQPTNGFLWDVTNCFRDNWIARIQQQAELWDEEPQYRMTPIHFLHDSLIDKESLDDFLAQPHWTWTQSPFALPNCLKSLVGDVQYNPYRSL